PRLAVRWGGAAGWGGGLKCQFAWWHLPTLSPCPGNDAGRGSCAAHCVISAALPHRVLLVMLLHRRNLSLPVGCRALCRATPPMGMGRGSRGSAKYHAPAGHPDDTRAAVALS